MSAPRLPIAARPSLIDRASRLRTDAKALADLRARGQVFRVCGGKVATLEGKLLLASAANERADSELYFLGINASDGVAYFADQVEEADDRFLSLREVATEFSPLHLELALHAVALSNWHHSHPRCARCGAATRVDLGGAARTCEAEQIQHHPRTDGAVIVLVKDSADRILLGHQPVWPEGRYSTFAGFLEPGETFEQCVVREVSEEAGVTVGNIHYLGSQPWPFPASIMIAFEAVVENPDNARPDGEEITDVRWFTRDQLRAAAADGSLLLPPTISVARQMIEMWLGEKAVGGESWR